MGEYHRWYWASFGHALANNLRALRKMRGLSQARLAQLSGLSRTVISNLERNESGEVDTAPFSSGYLTRARANELPKFAGSQNQWADQRADDTGL